MIRDYIWFVRNAFKNRDKMFYGASKWWVLKWALKHGVWFVRDVWR